MNFYHNIPPQQRFTQRLVDQFNDDEAFWRLRSRRVSRKKKKLKHQTATASSRSREVKEGGEH